MVEETTSSEPTRPQGRTAVVLGGTGGVGEGIVRAYLKAGATVVVPTRSQAGADRLAELLGELDDAERGRLHFIVSQYTSFQGAQDLAQQVVTGFGRPDDVIASIGGWWSGKALWQLDEKDWNDTFVALSTAHLAALRAFLPVLSEDGTYQLILGGSALTPVPGSGPISMEQAALRMMRAVADAELAGQRRVHALVLGPVMTRQRQHGDPDWVSADQVGQVNVALSATPGQPSCEIVLRQQDDWTLALHELARTRDDAPGGADA